nr:hypothetical protein CFP56_64384 [Quercus suber]
MQLVKLPTFKDPQPVVEEITSSDIEAEPESEKAEDSTLKKSTKSFVRDEDFKIFYHIDETEEEAFSSQQATTLVSENQEVTEVPEAVVIEKRLPDLLSLLESHAGTATLEVPIATQAAHVVEEWVDQAFHDQKEEESKCYTAQKSLAQIDKKLKETLLKLSECNKARKSAEASIESSESTTTLTQTSSTENPLPKSTTTAPSKSKPVEYPPSKSSTIAPQSSMVVTEMAPLEESSSTTKAAPPAPTSIVEAQPSREVEK